MPTNIEWTDETWNMLRARRKTDIGDRVGWHCERVSPGCQHCYAERLNEQRFGTQLSYTRPSRELVDVYLDDAALVKPLHWRRARKVFVCSMTDLFGEWVPDEMIDRVFAVMALSPGHTFQVLTKRPERMRAWLTADPRQRVTSWMASLMSGAKPLYTQARIDGVLNKPGVWGELWPLPNVWLGTSVEDQQRADERIPELLACPAAVRFLSCEPLLGPVNLRLGRGADCGHCNNSGYCMNGIHGEFPKSRLKWVIVGGESGPGARPMELEWARSLVVQCKAAGVACFVKQLGSNPIANYTPQWHRGDAVVCEQWSDVRLLSRHGSDMAEWPVDLRVREWPR